MSLNLLLCGTLNLYSPPACVTDTWEYSLLMRHNANQWRYLSQIICFQVQHITQCNICIIHIWFPSTLSESTAQSATNQPKSLLICFYRYWYCLKTFWNNVIEIIPYSPEPIQRLYTANLMWHAISVSQTIASPQVPVFNEQPFGCEPVCVSICVCGCVCVCNQESETHSWNGKLVNWEYHSQEEDARKSALGRHSVGSGGSLSLFTLKTQQIIET